MYLSNYIVNADYATIMWRNITPYINGEKLASGRPRTRQQANETEIWFVETPWSALIVNFKTTFQTSLNCVHKSIEFCLLASGCMDIKQLLVYIVAERWTWCHKATLYMTLLTSVITQSGSRTSTRPKKPTRHTVTRPDLRSSATLQTGRSAVACIAHATVVACRLPPTNTRSAFHVLPLSCIGVLIPTKPHD